MTCKRLPTVLPLVLMAAGVCGCPRSQAPDPMIVTRQRDDALAEARQLQRQAEELRKEQAALEKQIATLQTLGPKRLDRLYHVKRIRLGSATGGVDLDGKPGDDAVKVYLEPIDQQGSIIKAAGTATVQLFDLAAPPDRNLLHKCTYDVDEMAKHWSSGFIAYYYTFESRWTTPPAHDELTVRVEFTDYLTGRTFEKQTVCTVDLPPGAATRPTTKPATKPATKPTTRAAVAPPRR